MQRSDILYGSITSVLLIILFIFTSNDPFFGDAISSISRASNHIYKTSFNEIHFPVNVDPGHPITIPFIHAFAWSIFGKFLWVSHLVNLISSALTLILFVTLAKTKTSGTNAWVGAILLLITPLFVSQTINPNLHIWLTLGVVGLVYSIEVKKTWLQILFSTILVIVHLQGLYFLVPIWLWWFLTKKDVSFKKKSFHIARIAVIPAVCFVGWILYHHSITGWYISAPNYSGHRGFPGIKRFIVNALIADWRIVDYGQIALFILPIWAMVRKRTSLVSSHPFILFVVIFFFNAVAIAFTTKTGPMHRYLLPCLPLILLSNVILFDTVKRWMLVLVFIVLLSGHWWFYPGKVMGDATISYRSVFPLLEQAKKDFDNEPFHTYAPLSNPSTDSKLCCDSNDYIPLYDTSIDSVKLVLYSNISGDFTISELSQLNKWPSKTYQKGNVYVQLFSNPSFVKNPIIGPTREISRFEKWFIDLKHKIKGNGPT